MDMQLQQRIMNQLAAQRNREANEAASARAECEDLNDRLRAAKFDAKAAQEIAEKAFVALERLELTEAQLGALADSLPEFAAWRAQRAAAQQSADNALHQESTQ